jgi:hypothetical protein
MLPLFQPTFLLLAQAIDRQLVRMVEYLKAENRMLRHRLPKRLRVSSLTTHLPALAGCVGTVACCQQ